MGHSRSMPAFLFLLILALRPELPGTAYPFTQGLLLVPALVALSLIFLSEGVEGFRRIPPRAVLTLPWVMLGWLALSLLWTPDPGQGARECASLLLSASAFTLAFLLTRNGGLKAARVWNILLAVVAAPVLLRALHQRYFGLSRLREVLAGMAATGQDVSDLEGVISQGRVFAGFLNANMLAGFLALIIPVTLDLALGSRNMRRLVMYFMLASEVAVLALTGSAGGALAALGAAFLVLVVRRKSIGRKAAWAGVAFLAAWVVLVALRGSGFLVGPESSLLQRFGYAAAGIRMASVHPWLGWGAGAAPGALMAYVAEGVRPVTDPHNYLLRTWIEGGLPGLALLCVFLVSWLTKVLSVLRQQVGEVSTPGGVGLTVGAIGLLFHGLMDMDLFIPEVALFCWAAMGASTGFLTGVSGSVPEPDAGFSLSRLWAGGIPLVLVIPSLIFIQGEFVALRGQRAMEAGDPAGAAEFYRTAREILPFQGRFALEEGRAALQAGFPDRAATLFRQADALMAASPYPSWELGRLTQAEGQWAESVIHLNRVLMRYPTSPRIHLDLVQAYAHLGEREKVEEHLSAAIRVGIFDPEARRVAERILREIRGEQD